MLSSTALSRLSWPVLIGARELWEKNSLPLRSVRRQFARSILTLAGQGELLESKTTKLRTLLVYKLETVFFKSRKLHNSNKSRNGRNYDVVYGLKTVNLTWSQWKFENLRFHISKRGNNWSFWRCSLWSFSNQSSALLSWEIHLRKYWSREKWSILEIFL